MNLDEKPDKDPDFIEEDEYDPLDDPAFEKLGGFENVMEKIANHVVDKIKEIEKEKICSCGHPDWMHERQLKITGNKIKLKDEYKCYGKDCTCIMPKYQENKNKDEKLGK